MMRSSWEQKPNGPQRLLARYDADDLALPVVKESSVSICTTVQEAELAQRAARGGCGGEEVAQARALAGFQVVCGCRGGRLGEERDGERYEAWAAGEHAPEGLPPIGPGALDAGVRCRVVSIASVQGRRGISVPAEDTAGTSESHAVWSVMDSRV